jgi:phenylalanine-4-hydroxylase
MLLKKAVEDLQNNMGELRWLKYATFTGGRWNTLIGTVENPKIYGAGLLSSIGESALHDS